MSTKSDATKQVALPTKTKASPKPEGPFLSEHHNCVLFKRKDNKWKWDMGGTIQRYPKIGEMVIVAYSKKRFSHTSAITEVISIDTSEPNLLEVVFQDKDAVWMLTFPAHSNDLKAIKKSLKEKAA